MEDNTLTPTPKTSSGSAKFFISGIAITLLLVGVVAAAYYFGTRQKQVLSAQTETTPTVTPSPSETPAPATPSSTIAPSATPTTTPQPTPKPTWKLVNPKLPIKPLIITPTPTPQPTIKFQQIKPEIEFQPSF
ncbi:hypothetical protein A2397_01925 [Candidatus Amesbacteria bacterium RIFOXYB1_FULL_44_23]|uniref:Uncharacterized protein n=1 Tax=Candidatus Amesbacteria bacterium RIFOXYB1_FULL_44_23 TaxID=1797263 RepID=A0A1F4ZU99_9BACT|nr:MAG: hypothetical protein A2397_01925 [Candidatus Amesbacteria bacterium RIFOXYB1_FULL_44_23]